MRSTGEAQDAGDNEREYGGDGEVEEAEGEVELEDDAAGEGDDAEDPAADGPDEEAEPPRQVERRESRFQRFQREAREAKDEARALRDRLDRLETQRTQPQSDPQAAAREEQQFLESVRMMDPHDALLAIRNRERQQMGQVLAAMQGQTLDRLDRAEWAAKAASDPAMRRLEARVEDAVQRARAMGNHQLSRLDIFYRLYGEDLYSRRQAQPPARQQRAAQRRVAAQTTRPGSGRGEAQRGDRRGGSEDDADDRLLRSITAGDL